MLEKILEEIEAKVYIEAGEGIRDDTSVKD